MKNEFGFTLIELLVAITIGMVLIGLGSVSLNQFNEKQKIEAVKDELLANLRLARNYAITSQFPNTLSSDTDRVAVNIDNNGLMTVGTQTSGTIDTTSYNYPLFSKDITPNGVSITIDFPLKFSVTEGRSIVGNEGLVNIVVTGDDATKKIKIDSSGLIYETQE